MAGGATETYTRFVGSDYVPATVSETGAPTQIDVMVRAIFPTVTVTVFVCYLRLWQCLRHAAIVTMAQC